jgi:hypothetical protein
VCVSVRCRGSSVAVVETLLNVMTELSFPGMLPKLRDTGAVPIEPSTFTSGTVASAKTSMQGSFGDDPARIGHALASEMKAAATPTW